MGTVVHFGGGNIGRGFVGLILHRAGYEVVFADVADPLIDALNSSSSYLVKEVGLESATETVDNFRGINSRTDEQKVIEEIARADIGTTAVGPTVLKFIAPVIAAGLRERDRSAEPLTVMACENAINATDVLVGHIKTAAADDFEELAANAVFANTAVDRIVPGQPHVGLDVTVESYFEWAIEKAPFGGATPRIPDATWVGDLAPYIERKLFTVNTGHAATAYFGHAKGFDKLSDALENDDVRAGVEGVLGETKELLVAKHQFSTEAQQEYIDKIIKRFENPYLPDTVDRVGRQPLRKLSRNERLVGPAVELAARGRSPQHLLAAIAAALQFDVAEDPESVELQQLLDTLIPDAAATRITGLRPEDPLYDDVVAVFARQR